MDDDKQHYLRLGLFVVASVAILFAALFILGARSLFQPKLTVETYFDDSIWGLEVGAPVKYRGVQLGEVTSIGLSTALYEEQVPVDKRKGYIVVRATLAGPRAQLWRKELDDYIKRGLRVRTQLAGVTGQQFVAVDFLDPAKHPALPFGWEPAYAYVPSAPSFASQMVTTFQSLISSLDGADIQSLAANLNSLIVNLNRKLAELPVADAAALLKDARATLGRVDRVIAQAPIEETVRSLSAAAAQLNELLADPALRQTAADASAVTASLRKMAESGELDRIVKNLDRTVQRANALLADNQYDLRGAVQDLRLAAANLRTLSETAKRNPSGLLVGGPPEKVQLPVELRKELK